MTFSMAPLLMHSPDVPAIVRDELRAAFAAPEARTEHLVTAARELQRAVPLDCADVLELVGLPADGGC